MLGRLTRRVVLASALLVVLMAGTFAVLLGALDNARDSGDLARHSRSELIAAGALEKAAIDLETGQRGYVITHERRFLAPWSTARADFPNAARRFSSLADDPGQRHRAAGLIRRFRSYIRDYSVPLVAAARPRDPAAESVRATLRGKRLVDALRSGFGRYVATERALLTSRQNEADSAADRATVAASVGLVGSIVLIALFASYITRRIVAPVRRAGAMASRLAAGELSVRMPETGVGKIGTLERAFNRMGASLEHSRAELQRYAEEQASLRRVATLVARDVSAEELLDTVVREVAEILGADRTALLRYEPDDTVTRLAGWSAPGVPGSTQGPAAPPLGSVVEKVRSTGRPASIDIAEGDQREPADVYRHYGIRSSVAAPIFVGGHLWGAMFAAWKTELPPSARLEARLSDFTDLVASAIANAESRAELAASRTRVVAASDETRQRIERDLHDGTQQRLISVGLELRAAEALASPDQTALKAELSNALKSLSSALEELQEISRGIHPAILSRGGLGPALKSLGRRSPVPVELNLDLDRRLPPPIEVAGYYVVSEALANAVKHAHASGLRVDLGTDNGFLRLSITDDGVGGADPKAGSGLVGLRDRVEALGGELRISSAPDEGTALHAMIPIRPAE